MIHNWLWVFWLVMVSANEESPSGITKNPSFLRLLHKHSSSPHALKNQWAHRPHEDFYRHSSEGISHAYGSYPLGSTLKAMEGSSEQFDNSALSQDFWKPTSNSNFTTNSYYGYSRPFLESMSDVSGPSYQDSIRGSQSVYQYHQYRPSAGNYPVVKKIPTHYLKGKPQTPSFDLLGKPKYKKIVSQEPPSSYLKAVYPRIHKPYAKHKYPTQKIVHPTYRRYYQSPYQRYAISSKEMLRHKTKPLSEGFYKESTASPISIFEKYYTTERMDDTYPDGSATSEDYSGFNDTRRNVSNSYDETYEEDEKASSESEESSYDENTTRGYYGDRIYMSAQVPLITSDKSLIKNKYFIVRRTPQEDDIETIFE